MTFGMAIGLFVVALLVSRILNEQAMKELPEKKKIELIDGFSSMRTYSMIPIIIIIAGFYYVVTNTSIKHDHLMYAYFLALILYIAISQTYIYIKLLKLDFPSSYVKKYILSKVIIFAGVVLLFYDIF